jgi:hypothetical protein
VFRSGSRGGASEMIATWWFLSFDGSSSGGTPGVVGGSTFACQIHPGKHHHRELASVRHSTLSTQQQHPREQPWVVQKKGRI